MLLNQVPVCRAMVGSVPVVIGFVALPAGFIVLLPLSVYARVGAAVAALELTLQTPAHAQPGLSLF